MNLLVQNHNHYTTVKAIIFSGAGERNRGYALLMKANKPETVLYRAPTSSLLLTHMVELVHIIHFVLLQLECTCSLRDIVFEFTLFIRANSPDKQGKLKHNVSEELSTIIR